MSGKPGQAPTDNHPIWVQGQGWTYAGDILPGDHLIGADNTELTVTAVSDLGDQTNQTVYNLTVDDVHTYYIAEPNGTTALVHNCPAFDFTTKAGQHMKGHPSFDHGSYFVGINGENAAKVALRFGKKTTTGGVKYTVGPFKRAVGYDQGGNPLYHIRAAVRKSGVVHAWPSGP